MVSAASELNHVRCRRVETPVASVVIPTFNRATELRRCLDSLVAQTFTEFEVIICDDGSTDETPEVAAEYVKRLDLTLSSGPNTGGPAAPRNRGIQLARAPFIGFLDSDDWWAADKLRISIQYLLKGADLIYHDLFIATHSRQRVFLRRARTRSLRQPILLDLVENGNAINNSSVVVRRSVLSRIHGFCEDESLIAAEDYDAWLRIAKITERFVRIPQTLGYYWAGGGNLNNMARALMLLDFIELRHPDAVQSASESRLAYVRGRICYRIRSDEMAHMHLARLRFGDTSLLTVLKAKLMILIIKLRNIDATWV